MIPINVDSPILEFLAFSDQNFFAIQKYWENLRVIDRFTDIGYLYSVQTRSGAESVQPTLRPELRAHDVHNDGPERGAAKGRIWNPADQNLVPGEDGSSRPWLAGRRDVTVCPLNKWPSW